MPKRLKNQPSDPNQLARHLVELTTAEPDDAPEPTADEVSRVMAALGRRGGLIGGKRRLVTMTRTQRIAVAKKAAKKRWANAKRTSKGSS